MDAPAALGPAVDGSFGPAGAELHCRECGQRQVLQGASWEADFNAFLSHHTHA